MSPLSEGIGSLNESTLHLQIKDWYSRPQDRFEVKLEGSVIDIVRGDLLIEIQTSNFAAIRKKLSRFIDNYKIKVIYPIPQIKWIVRVSGQGKILSRRKSSKRGKLLDVFDELLRIPELTNHPNFSLEVLMVEMEEIRLADGKGSWRRRGVSILDRRLVRVVESRTFLRNQDFLCFLPDNLNTPFTNKTLSKTMGVSLNRATQVTYTLRKMKVLETVGKDGKALLFDVCL